MSTFYEDLETLINRHSIENGSNTPDFILAQYLHDCLGAFNNAMIQRDKWYGHKPFGDDPEQLMGDKNND